jgi:hypothetical protein
MHLLDEFVVIQALQIEFAGVVRHITTQLLPYSRLRPCGRAGECRDDPELARRVAGFLSPKPRRRDML